MGGLAAICLPAIPGLPRESQDKLHCGSWSQSTAEPFMRLITRQNKYALGIGYSLLRQLALGPTVTAAVLPFGL